MPFIPYGRQTISEADIAEVVEVLRSPCLTQGPTVPAFEQSVAVKVGARYGVAVNSATSALHIACLALGLGPGDRLWTSPNTFVASANCGRYCGAAVDFVDIEPATGLMSVAALETKLQHAERDGILPKLVVPVHLTGSSCDMAPIGSLAQRYGFAVLEDASHAIGGRYRGEPVGNCRYSAITVFSFHPVKIITSGEGGLATTNDPILAQRMAELRSHGIVREAERFERPAAGPWVYEQQQLGFNYRITDIQAALGLSQLQRLDEIVIERNRQLECYRELLAGLPVKLLEVPDDVLSSVHLAVIRLQQATADQHRQLFEELRDAGIGVQLHYSPVHLQPYYRALGFTEGQFPEAEAYASSAMSLPLFPGLEPTQCIFVAQQLTRLLDDQSSK
ncbi:UDP-4-amino-4,6-dideoxy-N-acetyl-beta-L-altrosamine transaminase [Cyanobium sp. T1B-Tous]|uniref:UDP-4-amino-4, 6-dideoxy-N-acetyl-beta-L-altrosamine transaminase n=1 Tax=Cyanobium sp. T1B-Tous TaxID=2823721 RepID=UPI0020CB7910|nr:UDP-4-amino-4,6-dideoxy-N-acetyl-beta-L-altrosamine transaminase [Cyanobium sp. T1B-Tous]